MVSLATVKFARAEAALLESGGPSHTGRGRCGPVSRRAPYRRAPHVDLFSRVSRRGIPFLRLLLFSKAREVVVVVAHGAPPVRASFKACVNPRTLACMSRLGLR